MLSLIRIFILTLLLSSCSSSLKVSSLNCPDKLELFSLDRSASDVKSFSIRKFGVGELNYSLKELFEDQNLSCQSAREVSLDLTQTVFDVALSLIPSFTSRTLIIYYR